MEQMVRRPGDRCSARSPFIPVWMSSSAKPVWKTWRLRCHKASKGFTKRTSRQPGSLAKGLFDQRPNHGVCLRALAAPVRGTWHQPPVAWIHGFRNWCCDFIRMAESLQARSLECDGIQSCSCDDMCTGEGLPITQSIKWKSLLQLLLLLFLY